MKKELRECMYGEVLEIGNYTIYRGGFGYSGNKLSDNKRIDLTPRIAQRIYEHYYPVNEKTITWTMTDKTKIFLA